MHGRSRTPGAWRGGRARALATSGPPHHLDGWLLPALLVLPQLLLTVFFFLWPAGQALWSSLTRAGSVRPAIRASSASTISPSCSAIRSIVQTILRTVVFCAAVSVLAMAVALLLAVFADREIRGRAIYRTLLIWPYAVAPAVAAVLWLFLLHPQFGLLGRWLNGHGIAWDYTAERRPGDARWWSSPAPGSR